MKIAIVSQVPFALDAGGLEVQLLATADALRAAGVQVELFDAWKRLFEADLLHCFGSDYQLGEVVARAKARGIPVVVSSVFAPRRSEAFYAVWKTVDRLVPMKTSFRVRAGILRAADAVVALTPAEADHVRRFFGVNPRNVHVVPNGVDARFFRADPSAFVAAHGLRDFVLLVASVDPLKNQLRLVDALDGAGMRLVLIGAPRAQEQAYADALAAAVRDRSDVLWIKGLPYESPLLPSAYAAARVHVLPSLVEVQPLAALEAAAAGANLVLSDLAALRQSFAGVAWYCDPRSTPSIRGAVVRAYHAPRGARYDHRPGWLLPWHDVAVRLIRVYETVLNQTATRGG
ncbi:MAG: glycosyltransferase [Armatimonadota bacterium]|nr:glycosyltransferase [Armatimonadota bacterium]